MYLKSKSQLWKIHGKWYDLNDYMKRHPGGEEVLKQTKGQGDVSALFETYHAFSEIESLHEMISKFEVEKTQIIKDNNEEDSEEEVEIQDMDISETEEPENHSISSFEKQFRKLSESKPPLLFSDSESDETPEPETYLAKEKWGEFDFTSYRELTTKIKKLFPDRNSIKTPMEWHFVTLYLTVLFMYSFCNSMFSSDAFLRPLLFFPLPTSWVSIEEQIAQLRTGLVVIASITWISLGFNIMHDASHYALTTHTSVNQALSKLWNALNLWNSKIWFYHHVLHHHSFTGLVNRDPDISNYYPFGIKKLEDPSKNLWQWSYQNQDKMIPFVLFAFPGQNIGQTISYCIAAFRRKLWRIQLPNSEQIPEFYDPIDLIGIFCTLAAFEIAILRGNLIYLALFLMSNNIIYALNVIFDHDSFENIVSNDYCGKDWLRLQIQHSSNFLNEDMLWTRIFGSINYQIEHHLFPGMSNYHYPTIQPIVQQYCQEHDIPYVHHSTIADAWNSFLKTLRYNLKKP
jgi:fatty acid desaturase